MKKKNNKVSKQSLRYAFKEIIWPRRGLVFLGLILILINRASGLVLPLSIKTLFDDIITGQNHENITVFFLGLAAAIVVQTISSFSLTQLLSVEAQNLISKLRAKVQQHIIRLPVSYFDNSKSGELVSRIMTDVEGIRNLIGTGLVQLFGGVLTSIVSFFILLSIHPTMTFLAIVPMALFGFVTAKAFSYIRPIFVERNKINAEVTGRLTESLGGIRVVKGFNAEKFEEVIFENGVTKLFKNVKKSLTSTSLVTSSATLLLGGATLAILYYGSLQIANKTLSPGDLLKFYAILGFMVAPLVQMGNIISQITDAFAGLDRMNELLNISKEGDEPERINELPVLDGTIEFKDVSFSYLDGKEVVHSINLKALPGQVIALVGSSGSGKSTVAGLAASFLKPLSGQVLYDGIDLSTIKVDAFRKHLGVVLQDDFLFEGTIKENIIFSNPEASEEELQNAVKSAYVNEFTDRFDDGLNTLVGERGVKLSGGQRQRVAIARAILANPKILILDEATSNLDTQSESMIQKSLNELMKNRTTIVIAHRLSTIRKADQILVLEQGEIVERGNHDELIDKKGRYHDLYTYQSRI